MVWNTTVATTASSIGGSSITIADVERSVAKVRELFSERGDPLVRMLGGSNDRIAGLRVLSSPHAATTKPARPHKKRRNQSDSYHARIQKKWNRRFGFVKAPAAFMVDTSAFAFSAGIGCGKVLVAHPSIVDSIRRFAWQSTAKNQ